MHSLALWPGSVILESMSVGKGKPAGPASKEGRQAKVSHIRCCHVCGTVNQAVDSAIRKCCQCGKHLAPFYFFSEADLKGLSDSGLWLSKPPASSAPGTVRPIYGFSTYWQSSDGDS